MSNLPLTDAIIQVVEYCVACRQLTGPPRYGPDENLCVRVKSLAPSDANKHWYQLRVTLLCSSELKCDVFKFLSGAECHLRTVVLHSQSLDDKSHLNITCPTSGSCQVYVRQEGLALTRYDKEETARGINFRFRVFMGSAEMAASCEDVMTYLRQLQTMHAQIQIKGTIEVPGHVDEFSIENRLPSRDKMAFLKVVTNPAHYTSLSLPDVGRVSVKCSCPHSLMPLRLVNSGEDVHFRLTVLASVIPPPHGRLATAAKCHTIKVLLFGPGGVPLLLPRHIRVNDEDMASMLSLDEYGLQATVASPPDQDSPLAHHWEYRLSDMHSDPADTSDPDPDKPHAIHLFFVFDRWNPSAKCDVNTLLDMQQTLRLNVNHVLLSCRCKVRKAVTAALAKVVTCNDPDRQRRKKYQSAIDVMSQSVCVITSRSTNAQFRGQCMGLVNATDGRELHNELKTRLWNIAKEKAKVKSPEPKSRRHLVATFDGQGALRGSQTSTQGSEPTDTQTSSVRVRTGLQASQVKTISLNSSSQVSTRETFSSVQIESQPLITSAVRDSTLSSGEMSLEQSTPTTRSVSDTGSQRLAHSFVSSQQSQVCGSSQNRSSPGTRNPSRRSLPVQNQRGSGTSSQRSASSEGPTVISQTSQATVAKILAKLQKNSRVKVSPPHSMPQFGTGFRENQRLEASGASSSSQFSVSSMQMMSDQSQPLIPTVVDNNPPPQHRCNHGSIQGHVEAEPIAVTGYPACTGSARLDLRTTLTQSTGNSTCLSTPESESLIPSVVETVQTSDEMPIWRQTENPDRLPNAGTTFLKTQLRVNTFANSMPVFNHDHGNDQMFFHSQVPQFGAIVPQNPIDEHQRMSGSVLGYDSVRMAQALPTPSQSTQGSVEECLVPQASQGAGSGGQGWHCPTRLAVYSSQGAPGTDWYPQGAPRSQSYPVSHWAPWNQSYSVSKGASGSQGYHISHRAPGSPGYSISHGAPGSQGYPISHGAPGSQGYPISHGAPGIQRYPGSQGLQGEQNYASQGSYGHGSAEYGRSQGGVYATHNTDYGRMEDTISSSMASQNLEDLLASCSSTGDDVTMFSDTRKRPHDSDEETDDLLMRELNNPKKRKIDEIDHSLSNALQWLSEITDF